MWGFSLLGFGPLIFFRKMKSGGCRREAAFTFTAEKSAPGFQRVESFSILIHFSLHKKISPEKDLSLSSYG
jgi:hypothetical protein